MTPEGRYQAKVRGAQLCQTSKGKDYVAINFEFDSGEGREFMIYAGWLSPKALPHTVKALRACGWKGDDLSDLTTVGGEASITVEHEEYNGRVTAKIRFVNPIGGSLGTALPDAASKQLATRLKAAIASLAQPDAPSSDGGAPPDDAPPPTDEDVPF